MQGISYANSSIVPPLIYPILGSSRHPVVGPVSIASLVMGSMLKETVHHTEDPVLYLQLAFIATFFAGSVQARLDAACAEREVADQAAIEQAATKIAAADLVVAKYVNIERIIAERVANELAAVAANLNALAVGIAASVLTAPHTHPTSTPAATPYPGTIDRISRHEISALTEAKY
ncbi:hypothetical protein NE237_008832 [Protea cynaroides]|uniref:SLC26A/SulP transporter domain-containing protein n=1 Tax=Protea cynaroides TaxID=273540 RepID=A0A9Q0KWC0_9MAGN|nr:hypothetical protein NE237_008832 [Protea cynaroides]